MCEVPFVSDQAAKNARRLAAFANELLMTGIITWSDGTVSGSLGKTHYIFGWSDMADRPYVLDRTQGKLVVEVALST